MKRNLKTRLATTLLGGALLLSSTALAYDANTAQQEAEALKSLGLFQGTDQGFELERSPSRMDALVMLLRMTGQEQPARFTETPPPFVDAPTWEFAPAYLSYAYAHGLTTGVDATHFNPQAPASAQTYITFMLRALGYDSAEAWSNWETLGKETGLLSADVDTDNFQRGDMVHISYAALSATLKDGSMTLGEKLQSEEWFGDFALAVADLKVGQKVSKDSALPHIAAQIYDNVFSFLSPENLTGMVITKENLNYFTGLDESLNFVEGYAVEPRMTAQAHSVVLLRVAEGEDVEKIKQDMLDNVDPYKWVCVGVEENGIRIDNIGNLICLVMDDDHSGAILKNFQTLPQDIDGVSLVGDTVLEAHTLKTASLEKLADKINTIQENYLGKTPTYYGIIPDKSNYAPEDFTARLDHDDMMKTLSPLVNESITEIALEDALDLDDYYKTDRHWRQEKLETVMSNLGNAMGFAPNWSLFTEKTTEDFVGTYRRQLPNLPSETFSYLESDSNQAATVKLYGKTETFPVYNLDKLQSTDPYTVFLSELSPVTKLHNPMIDTERKLVLFVDSFGTSIAPLFLEHYADITIVDLRFMPANLIPEQVSLDEQTDALFLYCAQIANNSNLLR